MRVRLRHISLTRAGKPAVRDELIDVDVLTIGRGTDNRVQLPGLTVPLRHSQIRGGEAGLHIERVEPDRLLVNGHLVTGRVVQPGDVMDVGPFALRIRPPEADEALLLEIEQVRRTGPEAEALRARSRLGIEGRWFSRRVLSWASIATVGVLALGVPFVATRPPPEEAPALGWAAHAWSTGPLTRAHAGPAIRCETCHSTPFAPIANAACLRCHATTARHSDRDIAALTTAACTSCHLEHRGEGRLIETSLASCRSCHVDPSQFSATPSVQPVRAFADGDAHPEFSLLVPATPGATPCVRLSIALPTSGAEPTSDPVIERSGLRFSHAQHLRPGLRDRWDQQRAAQPHTLGCPDCHRLDASGHFMQPVAFATHCQSCHDLAFSELDPTRQAPHPAQPQVVRTQILEFFARAVLGDAAPGATRVRRRPGRDLTAAERATALARADADAARATADLLGSSGIDSTQGNQGACAVCHQFTAPEVVAPVAVSGTATRCADARTTTDAPYAAPLAGRWMPRALFSHGSHRTEKCERCHDLANATSPTGMLPAKAACLPCHGEGQTRFATRSLAECGVCHRFHQSQHGSLASASP